MAKIMQCTCDHEYQDRQYGNQMRVHNDGVSALQHQRVFKCTVCSNVKKVGGKET